MIKKMYLLMILGVLITSCLPYNPEKYKRESRESVLPRAIFELECPKENIDITYLNSIDEWGWPLTIGVEGCGKKLIYIRDGMNWILNSNVNKMKDK